MAELKELLEWEKSVFGEIENIRISKHPISTSLFMIDNCPELKERAIKYNLTECELLVIVMLTGFSSDYVNGSAIEDKDINQKIKDILQCALLKLPKYSDDFDFRKDPREYNRQNTGEFLYRRLDYFDEGKYFIGKEWVHPVSLTASIENFGPLNSESAILKIKPLLYEKTKAHKVYLIRDQYDEVALKHPDMDIAKEWQVGFEFNAKFKITNISKEQEETGEKTTFTLISIEELEI